MPGATFNVPSIALTNTPWATIQTYAAADYAGQFMRCDDAPGGGGLVFCNGVSFQPFARGMQAKSLTLDAAGVVTWNFSPAFSAAPVITIAVVNNGAQEVAVSMVAAPGTDSVQFMGRVSRAVPQNLVSLLVGAVFSIFQSGSAAAGTVFHVTARLPTS